jgi:hypothetical protein
LQIMVLDEDYLILECTHVKTPKLWKTTNNKP